ncbi:hypothetical protein [Burkholderia ambifaria]|uniref:hypothetical protein n=1 Tax=Burkholderia ambifaria TaxID=152480 RepID=UPI0015884700|nr:hypothetical protein [Burkholderia ambifaria]
MAIYSRKPIGIAWFEKTNYERIRTLLIDGHTLPKTFEQWEKAMERKAKELAIDRPGTDVIATYIDPDTFPAWCRSMGLKLDRAACEQFASERADLVSEAHAKTEGHVFRSGTALDE